MSRFESLPAAAAALDLRLVRLSGGEVGLFLGHPSRLWCASLSRGERGPVIEHPLHLGHLDLPTPELDLVFRIVVMDAIGAEMTSDFATFCKEEDIAAAHPDARAWFEACQSAPVELAALVSGTDVSLEDLYDAYRDGPGL